MAYEEPLYDPDSPPRADVTIAYGGPVAPHWDIRTVVRRCAPSRTPSPLA
jgi:hypothetical protein